MKIKNREAEYWRKRFDLLEESFLKTNQAYYTRIKQIYLQAQQVITDKINRFYRRFADENDITMEAAKRILNAGELEAFKMSLNEYIEFAELNAAHYDKEIAKQLEQASLRARISRFSALETEIAAELGKLDVKVDAIAYEALAKAYRDRYSQTAYELFRATGIGVDFSIPDKKVIDMIVREPWGKDGLAFNQKHGGYSKSLIDTLTTSMARMCATGQGYEVAVGEVARQFGGDHKGAIYKAKRLVFTEMSYFSSQAQFDTYKELGVDRYQFNTELTTNVCEHCQALDQKIFRVTDRVVGVNADPIHPNCRCFCTSYYDDKDIPGYIPSTRSGRNDKGQSVEFPEDYTIQDWEANIGRNHGTWTAKDRARYRVPK